MKSIWKDNYEIKLRLYENNKIVIENFKKLLDIQNELIVVDKYIIIGSFLKISKMEPGIMEIYGQIKEIKIISEEQ